MNQKDNWRSVKNTIFEMSNIENYEKMLQEKLQKEKFTLTFIFTNSKIINESLGNQNKISSGEVDHIFCCLNIFVMKFSVFQCTLSKEKIENC